ncbi:D-lactate dehydrogenase mitochondrial [Biomphalaria pfeifferi]|uniref:Probable D-lactate dehydrogenase, mitochondrial n=1 Tax=Biomphalaria pfeifferi TaxID=112525 RepID=A0AAD8EVY0_BIOPF|nr:D-lactate dehydrogenase mitochondrial [Biomphalaria pfeifferi]
MISRGFLRYLKQTSLADYVAFRSFSRSQQTPAAVTSSFIDSLRTAVGDNNVSTSDAIREQHGHDESHHEVYKPDVVVFAESVEQVSKVAKLCNENKVPLIPFGSGTGLEGGVNALSGGVTLDVTKMNQIVEVNAEDFDCTVQPGVMRIALNAYLRDTGLWFPIDPGADASICGMCATSASGTNAVRYGTMRENVLNLQVVLPDGRVIHTAGKGKRCRKTSAGYNLTNLFVGSEGTLGIITQATIKLYGLPEKTIAAVCHFKTVQEAVDTVVQIMQSGITMAKLEFLDDKAIEAFNKFSKYNMPVAQSLFLEFHGPALGLEDQFNTVKDLIELNGGLGLQMATDEDERKRLWKARHEMLWACTALIPGSKPYSTDICVPISHLPEVIIKTKQWIDEAKVLGPMVGHVGDGNFHVFFPVNHSDKETMAKVKDISSKMGYLAMDLNGTCTGEHGIGMGKCHLLEKEIGPVGIQVLKDVKRCFDPNGIMNPGKIIS